MITLNVMPEIDADVTARILAEIEADPMGGWYRWPQEYDKEELARLQQAAKKIQDESEVLVCIGIGGSYLGHRAVIDALGPRAGTPEIIYAGNSLSQRELSRALAAVGDRDFSINVISKSGTTLEPARAFEAFKAKLFEKYGKAGAERIYATTDAAAGSLHDEAVRENYTRFVVPDGIGGRYSVLTPVGLLPIAVAGLKVDKLLKGASEFLTGMAFEDNNPAIRYAWSRFRLAARGYDTEVFATFEPATAYFNEWLRQLFGESEGKNRQGVFPSSVTYTTDLHSLGQYMQEGRRNIWETIINYPTDPANAAAVKAVHTAHLRGGIPVFQLDLSSYDEAGFGELIYFFELSCALSAKLFGVNPFDQPGVEAYKTELRQLLAAETSSEDN